MNNKLNGLFLFSYKNYSVPLPSPLIKLLGKFKLADRFTSRGEAEEIGKSTMACCGRVEGKMVVEGKEDEEEEARDANERAATCLCAAAAEAFS